MELLLHTVDIGGLEITLVDRHHDGDLCCLRMTESLESLGHEPVIGGDHEDNDIRDIRTACAHGREGCVTRGINEGDGMALPFDGIGTDALGDATRLAGSDLGTTDCVEQRGLAVIDMSHEGDDGSARLIRLRLLLNRLGWFDNDLLLLVDTAAGDPLFALEEQSVNIAELRGDLRFDRLIDVCEDLHPHQILDDLEGGHLHLSRQLLDQDRRLDVDHPAIVILDDNGFILDLLLGRNIAHGNR